MFNADTRSVTQNQSDATRLVVDLSLLLDAIDACEEYWAQLADPLPLFAEELRKGLYEAVEEGA
jgi:hypothetical protein